jgi:hypothetical protein
MSGKGSKPRPVDKPQYDKNHDAIDWNKKKNKGSK